jgi:hypothetical protein
VYFKKTTTLFPGGIRLHDQYMAPISSNAGRDDTTRPTGAIHMYICVYICIRKCRNGLLNLSFTNLCLGCWNYTDCSLRGKLSILQGAGSIPKGQKNIFWKYKFINFSKSPILLLKCYTFLQVTYNYVHIVFFNK